MPIVFRALKQILKNQQVLMVCVFNIAMVMSRRLEPDECEDVRNGARVMTMQYAKISECINELQEVR